MKKISLVMCVKNEEKGLEKAIRSCSDFVDEIIISVDRQSTDRTAEIAKKHATIFKWHDFQDDFAKMRNEAHFGAIGDWILFLDGHEFVTQRPNLEKMLELPVDGLLCSVRMENGTVFRNPRLYRNGVKFEGRVHEKSMCKKVANYPEFIVQHDRINGQSAEGSAEREMQRNEQVPRVMSEELKKNPKNLRALFHLFLYYVGNKDYKKAFKFGRSYLKYSNLAGERWFVYFQLAITHFSLNHYFRSFWYANLADNESPGRWEIQKLNGVIMMSRGKFQKAISYFLKSFSENVCDCPYKPWPIDNANTCFFLGNCYHFLSDFEMAGLAYQRGSEISNVEFEKKHLKLLSKKMSELTKKEK
jgi:glycosyltransferase involved in cell wall biosynthesis